MSGSELKYLFEPRSAAVIGASTDPSKIGYKIVRNIAAGNFAGKVYPINPKAQEVCGYKAYKSLEEIGEPVDLVTISIPAKYCVQAVESCAKNGVKFVSIVTSGFSEVGDTETEQRIVDIAAEAGMRILGPNIIGIYSAMGGINATFGPKDINPGGVALLTQSGALGIALIGKTKVEGIGMSTVVSLGNKCDIDEADLLDYLIDDEQTKVILMYIEGMRNGAKFAAACKRVTRKKPIIVIKSGRSKRGAMAAASHTGSLAGTDKVFSAVMKQCGVIRAQRIDDAFRWCQFLSRAPKPKGEKSVIVTNGGGIGVLAADACEDWDINLLDDVDMLEQEFREATPDFGSVKNPVDITGGARAEEYGMAMEAGFASSKIDSMIVLGCETAVLDTVEMTETITNMETKYAKDKPSVYAFVGGQPTMDMIHKCSENGVHIYPTVNAAVSCLGIGYQVARYQKEVNEYDGPEIERPEIDVDRINKVIAGVREDGRNFLLAHEAQEVMRAADIPIPGSTVASSLDQAVAKAEEIGFPVVMKVVSKDIIHKSDAGGVALNLLNRQEVIDAYEAIMHNCRSYDPHAKIDGVEIVEMVVSGVETIIGARIDATFGPTVMFGLGGIYVEVMKDIAFRSWPMNRKEASLMLKDIRSYPLLLGVRGEERKDIEAIIDSIMKVGAILESCKDISDIEINPLTAYEEGDGVKAVDVRILLHKEMKGVGDE